MWHTLRRPLAALLTLVLLPLVALSVQAPPANAVPGGFTEQTVFSGLNQPMTVAFSDDGRVFVGEKSGLIKVFDGLGDTSPSVFADLRTVVHNFWDRGLMGLTLAPDFPTDPSVYVLYAHDAVIGGTAPRWGSPGVSDDPCPNPPGATSDGCVISGRLSKLDASQAGGGTEQVLIEDWCQQYPSHSVGDLEFGPDGYLYASGGDGASFNFVDYGQDGSPRNPCGDPPSGVGGTQTVPTAEGGALRSQDIQTRSDPTGLNGTVIRIDPQTGEGAPGNPLFGSSDANERRIVAAGLRNPFRLETRPGTGELWLGDVGWSRWEEIDRIANPTDTTVDNFGWPCREGNGPMGSYNNGLTMCERIADGTVPTVQPHFAYEHGAPVVSGDGCSDGNGSAVSGVAFYPGGTYPAAYDGALFFADYSRSCIWVMFPGADGVPDPSTRMLFRQQGAYPVDLVSGPNGDLYYVDIAFGEVRRISYSGVDQPPVASLSLDQDSGNAPLTVAFDASASEDPEGEPLSFAWDLDGDGAFDDGTGPTATHTYTSGGAYEAGVRVSDPGGQFDIARRQVVVGGAPTATITDPSDTLTWAVGDDIAFSGSATDTEDGELPASALSWQVVLHHCVTVDSCHKHTVTTIDGVASGSFDAPDHEYPAYLELRLTATDSSGVSSTVSRRLDPKVSNLTVETDPPGLQATLSSTTTTTPFTGQGIVGSRLTLSTPATQTLDGASYEFDTWDHMAERVQNVTVPATDTTYTARFTQVDDPAPPAGLVAAYGFDAGTGTSLADDTGNGHTGTITGATWTTNGKHGGALDFDGTNDLVTIADHTNLDLTTGMTLEAWINPRTSDTWQAAITKEIPGDLAYGLYPGGPGPSGWITTTSWQTVIAPNPLPTTTWTHLALTYDGTMLRLYQNGTQVAATTHTGTITTSNNPLQLGGNTIWGEHLNGLLDDVRIYNHPLTPTQITTDAGNPVS